jgi:hypothetical protein
MCLLGIQFINCKMTFIFMACKRLHIPSHKVNLVMLCRPRLPMCITVADSDNLLPGHDFHKNACRCYGLSLHVEVLCIFVLQERATLG